MSLSSTGHICFLPRVEGADHPTPQRQNGIRQRVVARLLAGPIHCAKQPEHLAPNRGVRLEGKAIEFQGQSLRRPANGHIEEPGLQSFVPLALNLNVRMPLAIGLPVRRSTAPPVTDGVAGELQRHTTNIANTGALLLEKPVFAVRRDEHKESPMPQVLEVGVPLSFTSRPGGTAHVNSVLLPQLGVDLSRVFVQRDPTGHVEPVAVRQVPVSRSQRPLAAARRRYRAGNKKYPAPPVGKRTSRPLPCSPLAGPCGPLLLRPRSPTAAFQSPGRPSRAPGTTPAATAVPVLALTFAQSFALLAAVTPRA